MHDRLGVGRCSATGVRNQRLWRIGGCRLSENGGFRDPGGAVAHTGAPSRTDGRGARTGPPATQGAYRRHHRRRGCPSAGRGAASSMRSAPRRSSIRAARSAANRSAPSARISATARARSSSASRAARARSPAPPTLLTRAGRQPVDGAALTRMGRPDRTVCHGTDTEAAARARRAARRGVPRCERARSVTTASSADHPRGYAFITLRRCTVLGLRPYAGVLLCLGRGGEARRPAPARSQRRASTPWRGFRVIIGNRVQDRHCCGLQGPRRQDDACLARARSGHRRSVPRPTECIPPYCRTSTCWGLLSRIRDHWRQPSSPRRRSWDLVRGSMSRSGTSRAQGRCRRVVRPDQANRTGTTCARAIAGVVRSTMTARFTMTCPACSHSNPPDYAFCGNCGTSRPQIDSQVRGRAPAPEQRTIDLTRARATSKVISDTTRYLCAAVHLDSKLATRLVEDVLDEQHRALGPSSGVDVATVLRHALSARRRHLLRDGVLVVISLVVVLGALSTGSAWLFFLLGVLLIWVVVGLEIYVARYLVLAQTLQRRSFRSEKAPAPRDATTERRLAQLGRADDGNVTVHSGFSPFVGGGLARDGWSFAVDVSRPKDEGSRPTAFSITELHGHARRALDGIDLDGLEVQDRLFVNGQDIRDDSRFLPSPTARPVTAVPDDVVRECLEHPDNLVRHYLWVRMSGWRGELVLNLY